jgi:hypothetical protein
MIWPVAGPTPKNGAAALFENCRSTCGAGDGNRNRMTSLEGWGSTIELRPRSRDYLPATPAAYRFLPAVRTGHFRLRPGLLPPSPLVTC